MCFIVCACVARWKYRVPLGTKLYQILRHDKKLIVGSWHILLSYSGMIRRGEAGSLKIAPDAQLEKLNGCVASQNEEDLGARRQVRK